MNLAILVKTLRGDSPEGVAQLISAHMKSKLMQFLKFDLPFSSSSNPMRVFPLLLQNIPSMTLPLPSLAQGAQAVHSRAALRSPQSLQGVVTTSSTVPPPMRSLFVVSFVPFTPQRTVAPLKLNSWHFSKRTSSSAHSRLSVQDGSSLELQTPPGQGSWKLLRELG